MKKFEGRKKDKNKKKEGEDNDAAATTEEVVDGPAEEEQRGFRERVRDRASQFACQLNGYYETSKAIISWIRNTSTEDQEPLKEDDLQKADGD